MNFAIIGATGNVGRKTIEVLEKSKIEIDNLFLVASEKSAGQKLAFKKKEIIVPKNLKKISQVTPKMNLFDGDIITGNIVEHNRFGTGTVIGIEGKGPDKKAEIQFATAGKKKLLLQFAKLKVIG